jgi:RHS repeat-associated protein
VFYIHADHLNAPRAVLDTDGAIRWLWLAEPFGTTAPVVDPGGRGAFAFSLRFPGQVADAESGLFYNWNRYYDASSGRYTQSDLIGLSGGINTYTYVHGDPLSLADPTGQCPWCVAAGIGALTDLSIQLYMNGFNPKCVNWKEVAISGAIAATGVGLAARLAKLGKLGTYSTQTGGASRPTYRFFKSKGNFRVESHPISRNSPDWYSYQHWHPDFAGAPWSKMHWPLIEPLIGVPAAAYNAATDNCECQER